MVLFSVIHRLHDGLPLVALTDFHPCDEVREAQHYIKLMAKKFSQFPDRCTLQTDEFAIHAISCMDVCFIVVLAPSYPTVLGYCFLEEIQKEFISQFNQHQVQNAQRPYSFIQFDRTLVKAKQRYNTPSSLSTRVNVADMSQQLKLLPPFQIAVQDLQPLGNGYLAKNTYRPTVTPGRRLIPLNWLGYVAILLNVICAILNLTRGMSIINDGHIHLDTTEASAYQFGAVFLTTSIFCLYQIYLLFYHNSWRRRMTCATFIWICLCNLYTRELRNFLQLAFHLIVNGFTTFKIITRTLQEKIPDYNV